MKKPILIRGARQLLTLRGATVPRRGADLCDLGIVPDGSLLVVDGRIREVGATRRIENLALAKQAVEVSAEGRIVMPGFVDPRMNLVPSGTASAALARAQRVLRLSLLHGTTTWGLPVAGGIDSKSARILASLDPSSETIVALNKATLTILEPLLRRIAIRPLIQAGEGIALATGYDAEAQPTCSVAMAIAAACDHGMTVAEAISATTINSACALGLGDRAGSLETGKQADILILDTPDFRDLARARGVNLVHSIMKHGEMIAEIAD